jgi:hypothetical protein
MYGPYLKDNKHLIVFTGEAKKEENKFDVFP